MAGPVAVGTSVRSRFVTSDMNGQFSALTPLKKAYDIYGTFEVKF